MRGLAGDLSIAPNTIVKESRPGVGTVVAEIFRRLRMLARDAAALGISEDDVWSSLDTEYERIPRDNRTPRYRAG